MALAAKKERCLCGAHTKAACDFAGSCGQKKEPPMTDLNEQMRAEFEAAWPEIHKHGIDNGWRGQAEAAWQAAWNRRAAPSAEASAKPFVAPGAWFPTDALGNPMREYEPGKWEVADWPSSTPAEPIERALMSIGFKPTTRSTEGDGPMAANVTTTYEKDGIVLTHLRGMGGESWGIAAPSAEASAIVSSIALPVPSYAPFDKPVTATVIRYESESEQPTASTQAEELPPLPMQDLGIPPGFRYYGECKMHDYARAAIAADRASRAAEAQDQMVDCQTCVGTGRISPVELCQRCNESGILPAEAQGEGLTDDQARTILHKYSRFIGQGTYSDTEFDCIEDVISFATEFAAHLRAAGKIPA